jgi:cytochrome c-type biogenesis protein CcmH
MTIWLVLALMTLAAIFAVVVPLARRPEAAAGDDAAVYRDQLGEIERDRARGLLAPEEATAARLEVSRRLLAAGTDPMRQAASQPERLWRRRAIAVLAFLAIPTLAGATYLSVGSPGLPDEPLAARLALPPEHQSLAELVGRVEAHLTTHPDDGKGWAVVAPVYLQVGRFGDAVQAFRNARRLLGPSAELSAGLGEALAMQAGGVITADAKAAFQDALKLDPKMPRARFWLARAAEEEGHGAAAAATYRALIKEAPSNAPWLPVVRQALAAEALGSEGRMPAVDPKVLANASPQQRMATIRGMVETLAAQLAAQPHDLGGQLRLIRAWVMLGDRGKAKAAEAAATAAFAGDAAARQRIGDLALGLGIEG